MHLLSQCIPCSFGNVLLVPIRSVKILRTCYFTHGHTSLMIHDKKSADKPIPGHQRTLLPYQHHGESARCLWVLTTQFYWLAPWDTLCVYDLSSHDFLAMTDFRPSGFPPRSYPCAYSADRMGNCTPFLLGGRLAFYSSGNSRAASSDFLWNFTVSFILLGG